MKAKWLCPSLLVILLVGCRANHDSLDEYIVQTKKTAQHEVKALTPVLEFVTSDYDAHANRSPFVLPQAALVLNQPQLRADCWQPKRRQKNGALERFPLEKLSLKGVMSRNGSNSALVQTPSGDLVKINAGQYIGLNNGKVVKVTESYMQIDETLPDGLGCWSRRNVKLALN
ncbi:pilus assembly protein PilP [Vibrio taketomensis]|uniref:pilus assembly protein PilP n=1 Tax=Vibrio taketomensis TaxID=2572923 RepID=UPI00138A3017|nr:pilus assembly protein PilP [Vibrio taketomensis]